MENKSEKMLFIEYLIREFEKLDKPLAEEIPFALEKKLGIANAYGEIIYVHRSVYKHFGIYIGNLNVIHYTTIDGSKDSKKAYVLKTDIFDFLGKADRAYCLDDKDDAFKRLLKEHLEQADYNKLNSFNSEETVQRAEKRLGEHNYDLWLNNCEHFATWCKTGVSFSIQSKLVEDLILQGMATAIDLSFMAIFSTPADFGTLTDTKKEELKQLAFAVIGLG